jgi:hypothetical protein
MSVMYGLAERVAELIVADNGGSNTPPPTSLAGPLHPVSFNGKCLDVKDGNLANGALVQLWDCNGKAQQQFVLTPGSTNVAVEGTNFCLDVGSGPTSGTQLKIWTVCSICSYC